MAQLTMWDKQKHYSKKDFTCSIGKYDMIYFTFRNNSWKRFTLSDKIAVYISEKGTLRFDDPVWGKGIILKMKKGTGHPEIVETTRYVQLSGKTWPNILEIVRRFAGSYNFTEDTSSNTDLIVTPADKEDEASADRIKEELREFTEKTYKKHNPDKITSEELAEKYKPNTAELLPAQKAPLDRFMDAALALLQMAKSNEERVAIYNALAAVYGQQEPELKETFVKMPKASSDAMLAAIKKKMAEDPEDIAAKYNL